MAAFALYKSVFGWTLRSVVGWNVSWFFSTEFFNFDMNILSKKHFVGHISQNKIK